VKATILIVDGDEQFFSLLAKQLRAAHYQVLHARDGRGAVQMMRDGGVDLILLDILMPNMDGWETLRQIRDISRVPIIMILSATNELDRVRALQMGADDYLTKPISRLESIARIEAVLRRANHPSTFADSLRIDDHLSIDRGRRDAYVEGRPANLTPKEYNLLVCLVDNAGRICTVWHLLNDVWGWEYTNEINYVKVRIHHLRKKIEPDPARPRYILTQRGKGYLFQMPFEA
jgi:DNA-binding response OmpR family regulator